jgi:glycerophosphoryl diester phosphodiesterase
MRRALAAALCASLLGCGLADAPGTPVVEAHRGAAGYWPENSRTAILRTVEKGYPGIEFDLLLTKDRVPVLAHDPWISETLCVRADGSAVEGQVLLKDLTLQELRDGFLCGGVRDPAMPTAEVVAEPVITLDEVLAALRQVPQMVVHLDTKYQAGFTEGPEHFAEQIVSRWQAANLPNPVYASSEHPEMIRAYKAFDPTLEVSFGWPHFPKDRSNVAVALEKEALMTLGAQSPIALAQDLGADALSLPYQLIDRMTVDAARTAGLKVQVWTLNSRALLSEYCSWPVSAVITDYPEDAPCL